MNRDELLLFKQYDSASDVARSYKEATSPHPHSNISSSRFFCNGSNESDDSGDITAESESESTSCFVPHSSFDVTSFEKKLDYPGRESIEAAIMLFF
jgi:hypothetical protein